MKGSPKVTIRLRNGQRERLEAFCRDSGSEVSHVIRLALDAILPAESAAEANGKPLKRLSPPDQIISLTAKYRAWGRGDLREERNRLFGELLAASFACKQLYPRTPNIVEGYEGLLQLCQLFGIK
jgi:hypothetical protein